jgi:hypothetical protein
MDFSLKYVVQDGANPKDSFLRSFFIAREGSGRAKVIKAANIVPVEVQKLIVKGKQSEVLEPEQICEMIKKESGNTFNGFLKWVDSQKVTVKADLKRVATSGDKDFDYANWAINEKEVPRQDASKDGVTSALSEEEVAANKKLAEKPSSVPGHGRKIKDFFNRLPDAGGVGEPAKAIDLKSKNLNGPMKLLKRALEEKNVLMREAELAKKEAAQAKAELKKKAEDDAQRVVAEHIDGILHELTELGVKEAELEACRKALSGLDEKALLALQDIVEKIEAKDSQAGQPKNEVAPKEGMASYGSLDEGEGDVLPVVLSPEKTAQGSVVERLSNLWTQDTIARS